MGTEVSHQIETVCMGQTEEDRGRIARRVARLLTEDYRKDWHYRMHERHRNVGHHMADGACTICAAEPCIICGKPWITHSFHRCREEFSPSEQP